jgi:hypothetical protein
MPLGRCVHAAGEPHRRQQALQALQAETEGFRAQTAGCRQPLASEFGRAAEA